MNFLIKLDLRALNDIQNAIDYYDDKQIGLGKKFEPILTNTLKAFLKTLFIKIGMITYTAYL